MWRGLSLVLLLCAAASGVRAQDAAVQDAATPQVADQATEARVLFFEGLAHVERRQWPEAAERFRGALALRDAPAIRYNLAATLFELSLLTEADELIDRVLADRDTEPELRDQAEDLRQRLRARAGSILVENAPELGDAEVLIDSRALPLGRQLEPIPAAPGLHLVTARREGTSFQEAQVHVSVGATSTVRIEEIQAQSPEILLAEPEPEEDTSAARRRRRAWWIGGSVAAAALVTVVIVLAASGGAEAPVRGDFDPDVLVAE